MKVLVLWENHEEREDAENLAKVLGHLAPSLAVEGEVHGDGGVTVHHRGNRALPRVRAMAQADSMDYADPFRPFGSPPETLAEEAKRLLDAQEAAFADVPTGPPYADTKVFKAYGGQVVRKIVTGGR